MPNLDFTEADPTNPDPTLLRRLFSLAALKVLLPFARAFVFQHLWLWFAVPLGLPALGFWHAAGLTLLLGMACLRLLPHYPHGEEDKPYRLADTYREIRGGYFTLLQYLVCGLIVHVAMVLL